MRWPQEVAVLEAESKKLMRLMWKVSKKIVCRRKASKKVVFRRKASKKVVCMRKVSKRLASPKTRRGK